ncbi:uncharacterized protein N7515_009086 [Penicillium bovifimosum]|uniref:Uncharacterized protein n=1 Tax=Penicillium bovifimosum TaxID=126998 RepID=A0A9W9GIL2_9EURO|nr:uncharacterized protein N7515_009086 [Penicillium bovifimosum]KAJ5121125.1 hypothetical protein N7515_009086 [Penicillium bovifimosum]
MSPTMNKVLSWLDNVDLPSSREKKIIADTLIQAGNASNLEVDHHDTESPSVYAQPPSDIGRVSDKSDADILKGAIDSIWPEVIWPVLYGEPPDDELFPGVEQCSPGVVAKPVSHGVVGQVLLRAVSQEDVVRDDASQRAEAASKQKDVDQGPIVMGTIQDRKISDEVKSAKDEAN